MDMDMVSLSLPAGTLNPLLQGGMSMYFQSSSNVQLIFESWKTSTTGEYILSLAAVFLFACMQEVLRVAGGHFEQRHRRAKRQLQKGSLAEPLAGTARTPPEPLPASVLYGMQIVLYLLYMGMHYINMLFFMSYNVGICLAVLVGLVVGKVGCDTWSGSQGTQGGFDSHCAPADATASRHSSFTEAFQ